MNKTFRLILLIIFPVSVFAAGFTIQGKIDGLPESHISLAYVNQNGEDTSITAVITGGVFSFTGEAAEPELARLTISEGWGYSYAFYLENSAIQIHITKDDQDKTTIAGSASHLIYQQLKPELSVFFEHARQNESAHQMAASTHNLSALLSADSVWFIRQQNMITSIRQSMAAGKDNYAALYFIRWLLYRPDKYDDIFALFMQLSPAVRNGPAGKKLLSDFEHMHNTMAGQKAPEINGSDTSGHSVKLAALKGKVILLDFWASYCGPCRQENERLKNVYQKYQPAGFEIVSVSLDHDRRMWLRAIQADGLKWPQVAELRGGAGATPGIYDITDLPRNVLIDKTGKIFAKDIHGDDLTDAIETLLAKAK